MGTHLIADGPTRYFGGSIMTFALPYAAFIVIALGLYYIFKRPHSVPRMTYLSPAHQTSVGTREPGKAGVITFRGKLTSGGKPTPATPADPTAESEQ
jgi:hypothetical protein